MPAIGSVRVGGEHVGAREGLIFRDEASITIQALTDAELVLVVTA